MDDKTLVSRRTLVQGSLVVGAAALAAGGLGLSGGVAFADTDDAPPIQQGVQYGFLVNASKCTNCGKCAKACRKENKTPDSLAGRRQVISHVLESGKTVFIPFSCMHCQKPGCMAACPAGVISKRADGIVVFNQDVCIGCKYCYFACPFGVPQYGSKGMDKCDCCIEAGIPAGQETNCAKACEFEALVYGKISDLESRYPGAKRIEAPTGPSYLLV